MNDRYHRAAKDGLIDVLKEVSDVQVFHSEIPLNFLRIE